MYSGARAIVAGKRARIYWTCQIAGWSAVMAAGMVLGAVSEERPPAWKLAVCYAASGAAAIGWTHLYRRHIRRRGWTALLSPLRLAPRVLAASAALGAAIPFSVAPIWVLVMAEKAAPVSRWAPAAVWIWTLFVFLWSAAYFGVAYFEQWRRAELDKLQLAVAAAEARLHGLMSQLNPHFLFNCLNSVRALIALDPARAQAAVTALSCLMRYSMQAGQRATVPLETEMEMVRNYLSLEGVRLDERLTCEIDIATDTRSIQVPTMLVQSLVENGVKHGIERLPAGGAIGVASWLERGALRVRVTSSGRIAPQSGSTRVGLVNARERLRLLYGAAASLALREDGGRVVADLSVPLAAEPA
jgi:hypothetical protein